MSKNKKEIIDNEDGTMAEFLKNACKITAARSPSLRATLMCRAMPTCGTLCGKRPRKMTFISASDRQ